MNNYEVRRNFRKGQLCCHSTEFIDAGSMFRACRLNKTEHELNALRGAAEHSARGIETVISKVKIGMTEKEIAVMVANELSERTGELVPFNLVQVGQNSAIPHAQATDKKLQNGDVLLVDAGTTFKYYYGDITNTTIIGRPNKKFLEIYDLVEEANRRAFEASKAGAIPEEVDQAARSFLESKGYG